MHTRVLALLALAAPLACGPAASDDDATAGDSTGETGDTAGDGDGDGDGDGVCPEECGGTTEDQCYPCHPEPLVEDPTVSFSGTSGLENGGQMSVTCWPVPEGEGGPAARLSIQLRPVFGGFTFEAPRVPYSMTIDIEDFNIYQHSGDFPVVCCDGFNPSACDPTWSNTDYCSTSWDAQYGVVPSHIVEIGMGSNIPNPGDLDGRAVSITTTFDAGSAGEQTVVIEGTMNVPPFDEFCDYGNAAAPDPEDEADWYSPLGIPLG